MKNKFLLLLIISVLTYNQAATKTDNDEEYKALKNKFNNTEYIEMYNIQLDKLRGNESNYTKFMIKFLDHPSDGDVENGNLTSLLGKSKTKIRDDNERGKQWKSVRDKGLEQCKDRLERQDIKGVKCIYYGVQTGTAVLKLEEGYNMSSVWEKLFEAKNVDYAELDMKVNSMVSADDFVDKTWGYKASSSAASDVILNQSTLDNAALIVAVIDSGCDIEHPSLKNKTHINVAELNGEPDVDDDNNGYVDDIYGWNFLSDSNDVTDKDGHGTHIAGIIASEEKEDSSFRGIAPNAIILPCKFTEDGVGQISDAIQCMEYSFYIGAEIFSNSWGGQGAISQSLMRALKIAEAADILQVIAAGNSGIDNDEDSSIAMYPASYDQQIILSVAAHGNDAKLTDISNYGVVSVDLAAPGDLIYSTLPNDEYGYMSGTSMATPFVSGAAIVLLGACKQQEKNCTALDVKDAIIEGVNYCSHLENKVYSNGYLNLSQSVMKLGLDVDMDAMLEITSETEEIICTLSDYNTGHKTVVIPIIYYVIIMMIMITLII